MLTQQKISKQDVLYILLFPFLVMLTLLHAARKILFGLLKPKAVFHLIGGGINNNRAFLEFFDRYLPSLEVFLQRCNSASKEFTSCFPPRQKKTGHRFVVYTYSTLLRHQVLQDISFCHLNLSTIHSAEELQHKLKEFFTGNESTLLVELLLDHMSHRLLQYTLQFCDQEEEKYSAVHKSTKSSFVTN